METIEKQKKGQTEKLIFRTTIEMKAFVKEFAEKMGMDTSDMLREMIRYYFLAYFTRSGSYREIRDKFFSMYPDEEKSKKKRRKNEN